MTLSTPRPRRRWVRPVVIFIVLVLVGVGLRWAGVEVEPAAVSTLIRATGPWGLMCFVALAVVANVMQVPGWVFVVAAVWLWGPVEGWAISYFSCVLAAALTFGFYRKLGGEALAGVERPWIRKVLSTMQARPVRGIALLRAAFMVTPPITVALSLSGVRHRDHLLGTAIGIVPPLTLIVLGAGALGTE